jgi:hypothetical protein
LGKRVKLTLLVDVLPSTIPANPTFYLSSTSSSVKSFLQPYINRAEQVVDHILDSLDLKENRIVQWLGDVFTQSTSGEYLGSSLECSDTDVWISSRDFQDPA